MLPPSLSEPVLSLTCLSRVRHIGEFEDGFIENGDFGLKKHKNFAKKFVIRYNEFVSTLYGFCMYNECIMYIQLKR